MPIPHLACYGWSVEDHGVVATDAEQKEDCGKSSHRDPESSFLDCLQEGNLLVGLQAVALLDTLLDLLQLHLHSWVPGKWAGLECLDAAKMENATFVKTF